MNHGISLESNHCFRSTTLAGCSWIGKQRQPTGREPPGPFRRLDRRQFEATGFFRTEHDGKRWWLVTPAGNAFLSLGNPHCQARDQAERAAWTREFAESAFARPDFVGWHICGIIDTWKTMPGKAQWQHCGLMTPTGEFYLEMEEAVRDLSDRLFRIASGT